MGDSLMSMIDGFSLLWMVYVFIVSLVTQVYWNYSMGEDLEIPNCQGAGYGDRNLGEGSRMQDRCQALPQQVPQVGVWNSSLVGNPAQDVPTCC